MFKIGDRVKLTKDYDCRTKAGTTGRIICFHTDGRAGICFDIANDNFHTCQRNCEDNYGYYVDSICLEG